MKNNISFGFIIILSSSRKVVCLEVNNHPQSGWLDSPPVRGADQGHVSAIGALFWKPSSKAMVFQKTIIVDTTA